MSDMLPVPVLGAPLRLAATSVPVLIAAAGERACTRFLEFFVANIAAPPQIEITAYIDRVPETDAPEFGRLSRAYKGVWNSRLQYAGDFETRAEAVAAIAAAYPEVERICCSEWTIDYEFRCEMPTLRKSGDGWSPDETAAVAGPPPQLAWRTG
jgi:hypothetical protein